MENSQISTNKPSLSTNKPKIKRGKLAKRLLIRGENVREFEEMKSSLLREILPQSKMEIILCEKIISTQWRIVRLQKLESRYLSELNKPNTDIDTIFGETKNRRVRNLSRLPPKDAVAQELLKTQMDLESNLYTAIKLLRKEQLLRKNNNVKKGGVKR